MAEKSIQSIFPVVGMHCASCARRVEQGLAGLPGVETAVVNLADQSVRIVYHPARVSPAAFQQQVAAAGFELIVRQEIDPDETERREKAAYLKQKRKTIGAIGLALPVFVLGMFFMHAPFAPWVMLACTLPVLAVFGRDFYSNAWKALRQGEANMDTLVAVSTGMAFLFSLFNTFFPEYWEAKGLKGPVYYEASAVIVALILLGRMLEARAKAGTSDSIRKLMGLQSREVIRIGEEGEECTLSAGEVNPGDVLLVKPGQKIPLDGVVTGGASFVDESSITGEPVPVEKTADASVWAGTLNQKGTLRIRVTKTEENTLLAQIIKTVREAQGSKAPVQRLADRIAGIFVPVMLGIAGLTFGVWMLAGGASAFPHALLTSVSVLVIACPCALGLATPTAIMVGIGKGAEYQILIRDAESLERLCRTDLMVLDKTGTLTEGHPVVSDLVWKEQAADGDQEILLALERLSEHPLAEAVVQHLATPAGAMPQVDAFEARPGEGISGHVCEATYLVGNRRLLALYGITPDESDELLLQQAGEEGKTTLFFAGRGSVLALVSVADPIKESARPAVEGLLQAGVTPVLLSGDNNRSARYVAARLGIAEFQGDQLPGDKAAYIRSRQAAGKTVAMVGDGINDSEALAGADISIAMGKGSDIAMDVAQVTLISGDLRVLLQALKLSRQTVSTIHQNLFWAFIYNLIAIPLAAGVLYPVNGFLLNPMIAAAAMSFSSISVVLNSLRIRRKRL